MGKIGATMPSFCLNRIRPLVRVRPPTIQSKNNNSISPSATSSAYKSNQYHPVEVEVEVEEKEEGNGGINCAAGKSSNSSSVDDEEKAAKVVVIGRKIMIVVDSSAEAKNALQWALTHTVQSQDMVILLYVSKSSNPPPPPPPPPPAATGEGDRIKEIIINPRVSHFLSCMKMTCQQKRPEVQVEVAVAEGKEKGRVIVEEAKKQGVGVLVIGQKKRSTTWRLLMMWAGHNNNKVGCGVVEYCIQNATCMAIAVRRKSKKVGGYLITTKRHKDFWLLA